MKSHRLSVIAFICNVGMKSNGKTKFVVLLQIIATTIARQSRTLLNSLVICAAFWLIFAIMAVQMFAGKFYHVSTHKHIPIQLDSQLKPCTPGIHTLNSNAHNFPPPKYVRARCHSSFKQKIQFNSQKPEIQIRISRLDSNDQIERMIKKTAARTKICQSKREYFECIKYSCFPTTEREQ